MIVKKFNYFRFITFIVILSLIIFGIVKLIMYFNYKKTYEYKLLSIGYNKENVSILLDKLNDKEINNLLTRKQNDKIIDYVKEKYFIYSNLDKYLNYDNREDRSITEVIAIINTEANIDWFDNEKETDTSLEELMLVNRLYGLSKDYEPEDLVTIPVKYAYNGRKISNSILDKIISLCDDAYTEGFTFVVDGSYRSYGEQEKIYKSYDKLDVDKYTTKAGHSEYQTGLSFDLKPYNKDYKEPKLSEEYIWLKNNAYKYGFILRFTKEKEYVTLISEFVWRLRYVGEEAAKIINDEDISFEEYYAYYLRGE